MRPAAAESLSNKKMAFGKNMKKARLAAGMTLRELSEKTGVRLPGLLGLEHEDRSPQLETAIRIAKALNVSLEYLSGMRPAKPELSVEQRSREAAALFDEDPLAFIHSMMAVMRAQGRMPPRKGEK